MLLKGSLNGIRPVGGFRGKSRIVNILEKHRMIKHHRNRIKMDGSCKKRTHNNSVIDQITINVGMETSFGGIRISKWSFIRVPSRCSIMEKKNGKQTNMPSKTILPAVVIVLNFRLLQAFFQAITMALFPSL
jgi:hypothetical protein